MFIASTFYDQKLINLYKFGELLKKFKGKIKMS